MLDNILTPIISWAWFLLGITSVLYFVYATLQHDMLIALNRLFYRVLLVGLVVIVGLNVVNTSFVFINPHQVGVVVSALAEQGIREQPMTAGSYWIVPLLEKVVVYPIGLQTYTMSGSTLEEQVMDDSSITARTQDGKVVRVDGSITFRIDPDKIIELHKMWQDRYVEDFISPALRSVIRAELLQYTIAEINSEIQQELEETFHQHLNTRITKNGLVFERFFLRNLVFSAKYAKAIEKKHSVIVAAEAEAQAIMAKAKAEAEAEARAIIFKAMADAKAEHILQGKTIPQQQPSINSDN
jgi:regulator of protease activity HflC (stomatin/prohibitin superfamily)